MDRARLIRRCVAEADLEDVSGVGQQGERCAKAVKFGADLIRMRTHEGMASHALTSPISFDKRGTIDRQCPEMRVPRQWSTA